MLNSKLSTKNLETGSEYYRAPDLKDSANDLESYPPSLFMDFTFFFVNHYSWSVAFSKFSMINNTVFSDTMFILFSRIHPFQMNN